MNLFLFMCMCVHLCEFMFTTRIQELPRLEDLKWPWAGVTGAVASMDNGNWTPVLQNFWALLTSGSSLQPLLWISTLCGLDSFLKFFLICFVFWYRVSLYNNGPGCPGTHLLCRPDWPWNHRDVLPLRGLKACATSAWPTFNFLYVYVSKFLWDNF